VYGRVEDRRVKIVGQFEKTTDNNNKLKEAKSANFK